MGCREFDLTLRGDSALQVLEWGVAGSGGMSVVIFIWFLEPA
jgi:hypothetical protein